MILRAQGNYCVIIMLYIQLLPVCLRLVVLVAKTLHCMYNTSTKVLRN